MIRIYTILEKAANAQPYIRDCNFNILLELTEELRKLYKESIRETLNFTPRELEIAKFGLQNLTRGKISDNLFLSKHTVTTHTKHITSKAKLFNSELKNFNEVGYYLEKIGLF